MSFDEYALYVAQKYRLAVSIAILKTKPENIGIDEYLTQIKNVIIEKNMQEELNISACSDDFNIDCSGEVNDLNDQNKNVFNATQVKDDVIHMNDNWTHDNGNIIEDNDNRTKYNYNGTEDNGHGTYDDDNKTKDNGKRRQDLKNCTMILKNVEETNEKMDVNKERRDKFREVIQVLKGVDVTTTDKVIINEIHNNICEKIQNNPFHPMDIDLTHCYSDNDNTFLESIERLTNADRPISYEHSYSQNHIENRQCESTQCPIIHNSENQNKSQQFLKESNANLLNLNINSQEDIRKRKQLPINDEIDVWKPKLIKMIHSVENNTINPTKAHTYSDILNASNSLQETSNEHQHRKVNMGAIDRKETHAVPDTQFNTHYSESQINAIIIDNKLIYGSKINNANQENTKLINDFSQNSQELFNKSANHEAANVIDENDTAFSIYEGTQTHAIIENDIAFSQNAQIMPSLNDTLNLTTVNTEKQVDDHLKNDKECSYTTFNKSFVNNASNDKCCTVFDKATENKDNFINTDANPSDIDEDLTDDQTEKIPFKIIEEMNQIKMYLNKRKDIRDTGFFGSSQSKCSLKSTQPAYVCVEESANSIFNYLSSCPLVSATQDLTEQISEILGQLIDRLHEEETYPAFLEELLKTIQKLLESVYEEESYDFDVLLKKDEHIHRIILISKSVHITRYTIEKINIILQNSLDEISANDTIYEIQNINKIENICYIFHILQMILPKYSSNSQASTQNSQDEKVLTKRDISDIWRKKWISNLKNESNEGSSENKCVLKDCSAILNKIIVNFMDGYSLIAFSALKCFNLMQ